MILLLGATSYAGQAFARALRRRRDGFIPLSRQAFDYTRFEFLFDYVRKIKPDFLINAAEYAENGDSDPGELDRLQMLQSNTLLPQTIARVCQATNTPWGLVSSGSIYSGAKVWRLGRMRIERDLTRPQLQRLFRSHPELFFGFTERDEPNCSFRRAPCSFDSGTRALAEEAIQEHEQSYIWRLRLPFNEHDEPANLLSRLRHSPEVDDGINSLSHLDECVRACLELWQRRAPFGIYNVSNPGAVTTAQMLEMIRRLLKPEADLGFGWSRPANGHVPIHFEDESLRSHCILDVSKVLNAGIKLRPVKDALESALAHWQPRPAPRPMVGAFASLQPARL